MNLESFADLLFIGGGRRPQTLFLRRHKHFVVRSLHDEVPTWAVSAGRGGIALRGRPLHGGGRLRALPRGARCTALAAVIVGTRSAVARWCGRCFGLIFILSSWFHKCNR